MEEKPRERNEDILSDPAHWKWNERPEAARGPIQIEWIDDNDGFGPRRLSRAVLCF